MKFIHFLSIIHLLTLLSSTAATGRVVFRLDDIQDYWITNAQEAVINVFKNAKLPITVGIIGNEFGDDPEIVNYMKSCIQDTDFPIEIANHGWNHEDFPSFTEAQQVTLLTEAKRATIGNLSNLISDITTFIPPFDDFNDNTVTALQGAGYNCFSSDLSFYGYDDNLNYYAEATNRAWPGSNPNVREYPAGSGTNDLYDEHVISVAESMNYIQKQISIAGWSVVMMHFNWYSTESGAVNTTMITMLEQLIQECQTAGYSFGTIGGLNEYLSSGGSSSSSSSSGSSTPATSQSPTTALADASTTGLKASSTTGRVIATTGKKSKATTGSAASATTGKSPVATTAKASVATTGKASVATTGKASVATTGHAASATTGRAPVSTTGMAVQGTCTEGYMQCLTSETYSTCAHGSWGVSQSCSVGTSCHPSGNYIYCY